MVSFCDVCGKDVTGNRIEIQWYDKNGNSLGKKSFCKTGDCKSRSAAFKSEMQEKGYIALSSVWGKKEPRLKM